MRHVPNKLHVDLAPFRAGRATGSTLGKIAYAAIFVLSLPALLYAWARGAADVIALPPLRSLPLGVALVIAGVALMAAGTWALFVHGGGLPMSAYPPPRFVDRGIYAILPHPMYVGFCGVVLGIALASGDAAGAWLVAPTMAAACAALVLGHERLDLQRRFGVASPRTAVRLPRDTTAPTSLADHVSVVLLVLLPWLAIVAALATLRPRAGVVGSPLVILLTYPAVIAATLVAPTRALLRRFAVRGLLAMALLLPLMLAFPLAAAHVTWAALAAAVLAARWPRARALAAAWVVAVAAACVATGTSSVVDLVVGLVAAAAAVRARSIWEALRRGSERLANSWREWRLGPARFINHGIYAGVGTALAALLMGALAGPGSAAATTVVFLSSLVCSALWAQIVEGSPQLLRPYGFYGGVLGAVIGSLFAPLFGKPTWLMLAACGAVGPVVQSLGRLRCLVQGCCHGSPAPPSIGIRYTHPRSRVCRLTSFGGVPVHPTPLYSIAWNVLVMLLMARLWSLNAPLRLIGGLYLVITGLGRFVEEAYRGEPQTKVWGGLRLYQWIAIASVVIGAAVTVLGGDGAAPDPALTWPIVPVALGLGLVNTAALGLDFPASQRRYSRLA